MKNLKRPIISVLMPAFNAENFLERAVASVISQNVKSTEIVIVDDASTDRTLDLALSLSKRWSNVKVLALHQNGGPAVARNAAIDAARGEWLAILDADDAYLTDHLERLLLEAKEFDADAVLSNFRYFDPAQNILDEVGIPQGDFPRLVDKYEYVGNARPLLPHQDWGLLKPMFKSQFLKSNAIRYPVHSRHGEDFLLMVECLLAGAKVILSPFPTYLYTARSSGWSRTKINYEATAIQSRALLNDPRVQGDQKMISVLQARVSATRTFAARYNSQVLWKERAFARLIVQSLGNWETAKAVAHLAATKMQRTIRKRIEGS